MGFSRLVLCMFKRKLRPGEIVEVLDKDKIAATLDEKGTLDGLVFMPSMLKYCGQRFRVLRRADKIIIEGVGIRHVPSAVILEGVTCDGGVEGCKRTCFPLWKEAWVKKLGEKIGVNESIRRKFKTSSHSDFKTSLCLASVSCQARSLVDASKPLSRWNIRRYLYDFTSGVYKPSEYALIILRYLFSKVQRIVAGVNICSNFKRFCETKRTPTISLNLQPGDIVRVKSEQEILRTLDHKGRNRGLEFMPEMKKYCGKTFRVLKRVDKMIIEQTGEMRQIANTVLLEGAFCDGKAHHGCPRHCYCLWREIWLERIEN